MFIVIIFLHFILRDIMISLTHFFIFNVFITISQQESHVNPKLSKIWGPGLEPQHITMPARYFFIKGINDSNQSLNEDLSKTFSFFFGGVTIKTQKPCRVWHNVLDRKDGTVIVRYKLYEPCKNLKISIISNNEHIAESPYFIKDTVYSDDCICPTYNLNQFITSWKCGEVPRQITQDLEIFPAINWDEIREEVIKEFDKPHSISLCHYIISNNEIYRKCYGKYVGFKMFMDSMLLSMTRKINLPNIEFFVNLGDWPLVSREKLDLFPIFSWCGSTGTIDIVMPTYDLTESTLEMMGRVMLDMLSVQGNVQEIWENRISKAFWRGRDSNRQRLDLIDISRQYPELFNVSLTNFFFFRDEEEKYGPKSEYVSFFNFFDYKYQLAIDGTVAAYRFPYLLGGGSLIFKQNSKYYEHFYNQLKANIHYIPIKRDLSDLVSKMQWALNNDEEAHRIAENGKHFANQNLLPQHIFCYYAHLLNEFQKRLKNTVSVLNDMDKVEQPTKTNCVCNESIKDEL